jgi:hypothetical protein
MIQGAREKLVREKIINPGVLVKPIHASTAYESSMNDWRYLAAAHLT